MMAKFMQYPPQDIAISVLAFFELRNGAERSQYPQQASKALDKFLNSFNLIFLDGSAADEAVKIKTQLEKKGISIGLLALLTAGIARSRRMTLVAADMEEFQEIQGLYLENWVDSV